MIYSTLRNMFSNWLLRHLYKAVTVKDLQKSWQSLDPGVKQQFKAEAEAIQKYDVSEWLKGEMEKHAMKRVFIKAKNEDDLLFGKAMLHSERLRSICMANIARGNMVDLDKMG